LTGPTYSENTTNKVGTGTIILKAPTGFVFDTGGTAPTVAVTRMFSGSGSKSDIVGTITSVTSTQIVYTVTASSVNATDLEDAEHATRAMTPGPHLALHPAEGAVGHLIGTEGIVSIDASPRRWGLRMFGAEKVALTTPWAGYRWGPVVMPGREVAVLPTVSHYRSGGEAPQPIGLIGAHRSRRDGDGTEFSSIRRFHAAASRRRAVIPAVCAPLRDHSRRRSPCTTTQRSIRLRVL